MVVGVMWEMRLNRFRWRLRSAVGVGHETLVLVAIGREVSCDIDVSLPEEKLGCQQMKAGELQWRTEFMV